MRVSEFEYDLPEELIAQYPLEDRSASRMLVLGRQAQRFEDRAFVELPSFLRPGDCLVLNDSKVIPCRLFGRRSGVGAIPLGKKNPARHEHLSARVEVLLLRQCGDDPALWNALVHPGRRMRVGERIQFDAGLAAEIVARGEFGERTLRFFCDGPLLEKLEEAGHVPLPPYIRRPDERADRDRYQTVFAREPGSAAAPTAGLHFTPEMIQSCRRVGARIAFTTLHVGLGTFQPLHAETVEDARLHSEYFELDEQNAALMQAAERIVAVGTTTVRTLETAMLRGGLEACRGETDIFIYPGFRFRATGAMLTNFHLPRSSLLILVCAFAGKDLVLEAYRHAVQQRYRFFSYGDCMLIV
jgi:S-adenosylmethionine:tRNA ribosyltransferase-isomerase